MRSRIRKDGRTERGASAVEFALVVIPLLMVVAGIVNFGFVFAQQLALDNSVRAGARAGVVDTGNDPATVTTDQWNSTVLAKSQTGALAVTYPGAVGSSCAGSSFGDSLVVRGTVTATFLVPWPLPKVVIPKSVTLTSQAEFQCEYQ
jgi:Flp pilus assembly protein TadG